MGVCQCLMTTDCMIRLWGSRDYGESYWIDWTRPFDEDTHLVAVIGPGVPSKGQMMRHIHFCDDGSVRFLADVDT